MIFVDVGYLLAAGGTAYCATSRRSQIACDYEGLSEALHDWVRQHGNLPVLRSYWYDGAQDGVLTLDQQTIAALPRVKLRLGRLVWRTKKKAMEQKGVDSLIVHDLITLAHERAAATMFLLAGDEDLREGVAAAQRLGVQVVLLGVNTNQPNQSLPLVREADQHVMLESGFLEPFFARAGAPEHSGPTATEPEDDLAARARELGAGFALAWVAASDPAQIAELLGRQPEIPRELDIDFLVRAEGELEQSLRGKQEVRHALRAGFWEGIAGAREDGEPQEKPNS